MLCGEPDTDSFFAPGTPSLPEALGASRSGVEASEVPGPHLLFPNRPIVLEDVTFPKLEVAGGVAKLWLGVGVEDSASWRLK